MPPKQFTDAPAQEVAHDRAPYLFRADDAERRMSANIGEANGTQDETASSHRCSRLADMRELKSTRHTLSTGQLHRTSTPMEKKRHHGASRKVADRLNARAGWCGAYNESQHPWAEDASDLWHDGGSEWRGRFSWPCGHGIQTGACGSAWKADKFSCS